MSRDRRFLNDSFYDYIWCSRTTGNAPKFYNWFMPLQPVVVRQHPLLITSSQSFPPSISYSLSSKSLSHTHTQSQSLSDSISLSHSLSLRVSFSRSLSLLRVTRSLFLEFLTLSESLSLSQSVVSLRVFYSQSLPLSRSNSLPYSECLYLSCTHTLSESLSLSLFTVSPSNI